MSDITLQPILEPFKARIAPPGSKSLTNRALVLAALADGTSTLSNVLFADDTVVMLDALKSLGIHCEIDSKSRTVIVHGTNGTIPTTAAELFCGNSGTTIRFLAALCTLGQGSYTLDGIARMRQRPIRQLVDLLRNLGTRVEYLGEDGFPPIKILADKLPGGILTYGSAASSQYLSAVLMSCPHARHEVHVDLQGTQTSWPYVAMTMQLMDRFGHTVELIRDTNTGDPKQIIVPLGNYVGTNYPVEPDASNAAYFLAIAAVHKGAEITIEGLGNQSLQGDIGFANVLKKMGADVKIDKQSITVKGTGTLEGVDVNFLDMPDQAQTLAVTAMFAEGETIIRGLHTLKLKETDRLQALSNELQKFGAKVEIENDSALKITPPKIIRRAEVDTYDDHRMAMSFSIAATKVEHVVIRNKECVNKTYPEYFEDLEKVRKQM